MHTITRRLGALLVLLAALLGLVVWFGTLTPAPALGAYPGTDHLATDYDAYVGERVAVGGTVRTTDPVTITSESDTGETVRLTVTDLDVPVDRGDQLRVYGVLGPNRTLRASNAFTVPAWGHWYAYVVSFLAGCWVLVRVLRHWRLDARTWTLERRATPVWGRLVGATPTDSDVEGDDA